MNHYKFKWKRCQFSLWSSKKVCGHKLEDNHCMCLYLASGGIYVIPNFHKCYMYLGVDWKAFTKHQMEKDAGQQIPIN